MKTLATALNILGFTALFIAYTEGMPAERPTGVRRALQTYDCQSQPIASPAPKAQEMGVKIRAEA